ARGQVPIDAEPARTGLVHELELPVGRAQRTDHLVERLKVTGDHAVMADVAAAVTFGNRDVNRFLVDIEPYEHATVPHDLPPRVWHGAKRQTLRIIHDVTRGRSTLVLCGRSQRHWTICSPPSRPPHMHGGPRRRPSTERYVTKNS